MMTVALAKAGAAFIFAVNKPKILALPGIVKPF